MKKNTTRGVVFRLEKIGAKRTLGAMRRRRIRLVRNYDMNVRWRAVLMYFGLCPPFFAQMLQVPGSIS